MVDTRSLTKEELEKELDKRVKDKNKCRRIKLPTPVNGGNGTWYHCEFHKRHVQVSNLQQVVRIKF